MLVCLSLSVAEWAFVGSVVVGSVLLLVVLGVCWCQCCPHSCCCYVRCCCCPDTCCCPKHCEYPAQTPAPPRPTPNTPTPLFIYTMSFCLHCCDFKYSDPLIYFFQYMKQVKMLKVVDNLLRSPCIHHTMVLPWFLEQHLL